MDRGEKAVASDANPAVIRGGEPRANLLVGISAACESRIAYIYAFAGGSSAKCNSHKAVETDAEFVFYAILGNVEIFRGDYLRGKTR